MDILICVICSTICFHLLFKKEYYFYSKKKKKLFQNTFKSQGRAIDQNPLHLLYNPEHLREKLTIFVSFSRPASSLSGSNWIRLSLFSSMIVNDYHLCSYMIVVFGYGFLADNSWLNVWPNKHWMYSFSSTAVIWCLSF